jgi:hypothetical protein
MSKVLTISYGVVGGGLSFALGGIASLIFSDPVVLGLGALGGLLAFLLFLNWALHPVVNRCPTCYPRPGRRLNGVCSRCALSQADLAIDGDPV